MAALGLSTHSQATVIQLSTYIANDTTTVPSMPSIVLLTVNGDGYSRTALITYYSGPA